MSSKQLDSIMGRMVKPTPSLSVVNTAPAPTPATTPEPEPVKAPVPVAAAPVPVATPQPVVTAAPAPKAKKGEGRAVSAKAPEPDTTTAPVAEPERAIQAYVPISVAKAINMRAAQEDVTVRSIILQGLQAIGFEISEDQVRDRRR